MDPLHLPVIIGTSRQGRVTENVAHFVEQKAKEAGFTTELIDVRDYHTPDTERYNNDPKVTAWEEVAAWADGFLIVVPEYNHSFPGELKILLDKALKEYDRKVVAVCTVSDGNLGGTRVFEHLIPVFTALGMTTVSTATYFTRADRVFDEDGELKPEEKKAIESRLNRMLGSLLWYTKTLKAGRDQIK
jgi:NAD(P)H-dependent FMN reductase